MRAIIIRLCPLRNSGVFAHVQTTKRGSPLSGIVGVAQTLIGARPNARSPGLRPDLCLRLVGQTFGSWNQIREWLRRLETLRPDLWATWV